MDRFVDIGLARDIVWSMFGTTTSRAAPMMALRDPYGHGRLVWGLYVNVMWYGVARPRARFWRVDRTKRDEVVRAGIARFSRSTAIGRGLCTSP